MFILPRRDYPEFVNLLDGVEINAMFAEAVIRRMVPGEIQVDSLSAPRVFHIVHPYGMSLLFGEAGNREFNAALLASLRTRPPRWIQAYPFAWDPVLAELFRSDPGIGIEFDRRVNFRFRREGFVPAPSGDEIRAIGGEHFAALEGSVVPPVFWAGAAEFAARGAGFEVLHRGQPVCQAFSATIIGRKLELGIETRGDFRGKGLARRACSRLIEYCLEHGFEPVWACRAGNVGSVRLAESLGFEAVREIPYYCLARR
jgi:GNAT superfamily N-acetyltransferase